MPIEISLATATRNVAADAYGAEMDGGFVDFRTGTRPASPAAAATGTLCGEVPLDDPAFGAASSGSISLAGTPRTDASANNTGTVTWARVFKADHTTPVMDCNVSTSGAAINVSTTSFVSGQPIVITSMTLTVPAST